MAETTGDTLHRGGGDSSRPHADSNDTVVSTSLRGALEVARGRLLERSLRNKLINTPLQSQRARQVRVFDEKPDQVYNHLRSKKFFTFLPSTNTRETDEDGGQVWTPPDETDPERHSDGRLQTQLSPEGLQKRLLSLFYEGQTIEEEQGVSILFLVLGFLEWREADHSEVSRFAPLVLVPVELTRDGARDRFKLRLREEDLNTNVSLKAWLSENFKVELPEIQADEVEDWTPSAYCAAVSKAVDRCKGWHVHENEILLGFFSFSKFLLWRDLNLDKKEVSEARLSLLTDSPLLRRLLLREVEDEVLNDVPVLGDNDRIEDRFSPGELVHIRDADSSQAIAIQEAMTGKNLVIQGPPGTGKSQTITNIIAGAVCRGKRVLFIAEKMAALSVVHNRLVETGLGQMCLELHSRKASKTQVLEQLRQAVSSQQPGWAESAFAELAETQHRLRRHSDLLHHAESGPWSAFTLMGEISVLKGRGVPTPDFELPGALNWSPDDLERIARDARQLAGRLAIVGVPAVHPWRGAGIGPPDVLTRERIRNAVELCRDSLRNCSAEVSEIARSLEWDSNPSLAQLTQWEEALELLARRPSSCDDIIARSPTPVWLQKLRTLLSISERYRLVSETVEAVLTPEGQARDWRSVRATLASRKGSFLRILHADYRKAVRELRGFWMGTMPRSEDERLRVVDLAGE